MQVRIFGNSSATPDHDVVGIDLGNGLAALAVLSVANNKSAVPASANAQQMLAANASRIGAIIVNDADQPLHIQDGVSPGGEVVLAAGASYQNPDGFRGAILGYWEGTPTGQASIAEVTF